jgi:hypothetical protein
MSEGLSGDSEAAEWGTRLHHATTISGSIDGTMAGLSGYDRELVERAVEWLELYRTARRLECAFEEHPLGPLSDERFFAIPDADRPHGTADRVYLDHEKRYGEVLDLKFGPLPVAMEIVVPQMEAYTVMVFEGWPTLETVVARVYHVPEDSEFSQRFEREQLPELCERICLAIDEANRRPAELRPSELACKYCPGAVRCPALRQSALQTAEAPQEVVPATPDAFGAMIAKAKLVGAWAEAFLAFAKRWLQDHPEGAEGWQLQERAGRRSIPDPKKAVGALKAAHPSLDAMGLTLDAASVSYSKLEDLYWKARKLTEGKVTKKTAEAALQKILEGLVERGERSVSLVPVRGRVLQDEAQKGMIDGPRADEA